MRSQIVQARFFLADEGDHIVQWSEICKPREQGGLGIMSSKWYEYRSARPLALAEC